MRSSTLLQHSSKPLQPLRRRGGALLIRAAAHSSTKKSLIQLKIPFRTDFGDSLAVVSSSNGWQAEQAVRFTWGEGDVWSGELQAEAGPLEYKYVLQRGEEVSEWQPGENLVVDVPENPSVIYVEDRWDPAEPRSVQVQRSANMPGPSKPASSEAPPAPTAAAEKPPTVSAASSAPAAQSSANGASPEGNEDKPLSKRKLTELKDLLKANGLKVSGNKAELLERLREAGINS